MNEERARGLVSMCENAPSREAMDSFMAINRDWYFVAKGYIEAIKQMKPLVDALRRIADADYRGNRSPESVDAYHALKKWEAERGSK